MNIKNFIKSKNIQAAIIATTISAIVAIISTIVNYDLIEQANNLAIEANTYAKDANIVAKKSYDISNEIFKSKEIPRLVVSPLSAEFYVPEDPEVSGQVKINLAAIIENLSEVTAREIAINFETEDWYGHKTSLFDIYKTAQRPIPHILSLPKNSRLLYPSYAPDAPSTGEHGFVNQEKPFKLKLTLYWKDVNSKEYVYVGFYDLKSSRLPNSKNQLYFQPINTYDSIKDTDEAWDYAKQSL